MTDSSSRLRERHGAPETVWRDRQRRGEIPGEALCPPLGGLIACRTHWDGARHLLVPVTSTHRLDPPIGIGSVLEMLAADIRVARYCRRACEQCMGGGPCRGRPGGTVGDAYRRRCLTFKVGLPRPAGDSLIPVTEWVTPESDGVCGSCLRAFWARAMDVKALATGSTLTLREARAGHEGLW